MDDEERLLIQANATTRAHADTKVWVYRNSVYGYPWYSAVRTILDDPAYDAWFMCVWA